jgi:ABC-type multidrug transport system ATPase subunit
MKENKMEYALKLENVTKEYKDFKLDNINIALPKGSIMGFIGENGAGKTTAIKLILDLINRDKGKITILGISMPDEETIKLLIYLSPLIAAVIFLISIYISLLIYKKKEF